jgi:N-succinyldiaminopimelate aminotransferase
MQRSALQALEHGDPFLDEARAKYVEARDFAFDAIDAPCLKPQGATYLWLHLSRWIDDEDADCVGLLERFADAGLLVAPGHAFGSRFGQWARLCFTAVSRERLAEGIERLNKVLEEVARG